eukprot:CAMPEP_0175707346 /NCGR_PEP_ID=MMETSP0097-20121207/38510_1 /TAXON_ID=311494 /ORGANISM="Alexandrium monilatum, Strain CCMP3105" /LENGTH=37 /DNA_ID= /DNA_START= /DNA_END= /DNA_ORIENTATION=
MSARRLARAAHAHAHAHPVPGSRGAAARTGGARRVRG